MREFIWVLIAVLLAYIVYQLWRVLRMNGGARAAGGARRVANEAAGDDAVDAEEAVYSRPAAAPKAAEGAPAVETFQLELELQQLRRDINRLRSELAEQRKELTEQRKEVADQRKEVGGLREEVGTLAGSMRAQKEQIDANLATQGVSPEYNEALVFARRGLDVEAIAERCGISVAEAELVRSLAQRGAEPGKKP